MLTIARALSVGDVITAASSQSGQAEKVVKVARTKADVTFTLASGRVTTVAKSAVIEVE